MAKLKGKGVVLAGLAAGAASFLRKKENRDKLVEYFNQARSKVTENGALQGFMSNNQNTTNNSNPKVMPDKGGPSSSDGEHTVIFNEKDKHENYVDQSKSLDEKIETIASTIDTSSTMELEGNHFIEEGSALTLIDAYNELQDDSNK